MSLITFGDVGGLVFFLIMIVMFFRWKFGYWEKRGLIVVRKPIVPFGNLTSFVMGRATMGKEFVDIYTEAKRQGLKHTGIYQFHTPAYVPIDPELVKNILVKDFDHFVNHGIYASAEHDPLNYNLFTSEDSKWRNMRAKLTPTFTSGKMKMMFAIMAKCGNDLEHLVDKLTEKNELVDIKEVLARFSTDVIGSCAFGLESNSLGDPNSNFRIYGKKVFETDLIRSLKLIAIVTLPPSVSNFLRIRVTDKEVEEFFMNTIQETVDYRETRSVCRKDFMHLLLQLKNLGEITDDDKVIGDIKEKSKGSLTMIELAAQAFVFFTAGFETSSTTMTWALYEISRNCDVQDKLRKEIETVLKRYDGNLSYDAVMEMTYLDKIIKETLRMYPSVSVILRACNKTYPIPGTSLVLDKDTQVRIPVLGLHTDPEYYPEPDKFDPERFSEEEKSKRPACTYLPFGEGPRHCIGMRFGLMQTKIGVITLVRNYKIRLNKKTKVPVQFEARSIIPAARGGIWLDFEKL